MWRKLCLAPAGRTIFVAISSNKLRAALSHVPAYIHAFCLGVLGFSTSSIPLSSTTSGFSSGTTHTV